MTSLTIDFSDWSNPLLNNVVCSVEAFQPVDADPAQFSSISSGKRGCLYTTAIPAGITTGTQFTAYARVNPSAWEGRTSQRLGLYISDGTKYYKLCVERYVGTSRFVLYDAASRCAITTLIAQNVVFGAGYWIWVKLTVDKNGNINCYYHLNSVSKPTVWTELTSLARSTSALNGVTEFGAFGSHSSSGAPDIEYYYIDDIEVEGSGRHQSIEDLDLGTAVLQDIYAYSKIGGGGRCLITIGDPGLANRRTIEANTGKAIVIKDLSYINPMFLGEVSKFSIINANQCRLEVKEGSQKMLDNVTNHNPIIYSGKVRHRKTNSILDRDAAYLPSWGDNAYAISLEKVNPKLIKIYPDSAVFSSDVPPVDNEQGSIDYCYFDEPELVIQSDATVAREVDNGLYLDISFEFWLPEGAVLDPGDLLLRFRLAKIISGQFYTPGPKIQIWRILPSTAWETIKQWGTGDGIHRSNDGDQGLAGYEDFTKIYEYAIDLSTVLDQSTNSYFDEIEAENASGLTHHRVKFRIDHGSIIGGGTEKYQIALHYAHLIGTLGDFGDLVEPQVGLGRLHTDTSSTILVFENTGWGSVQLPAEDGFSDGDTFVITKWIPDIVADAFSAAGIGLLLDWDVTDSTNYTITENISKTKLATLLQQLSSQFNAYWWFDAINTIYVRSIDNASSTSIILTDKDIESYLDGTMKYDADGEKLREKLTIIGRNVSYTIDPLTPEHNLLLDTATIIIKDGSISTVRAAKRMADSMRFQFEKTIKEIRLPLNFSDPLQSYRDLKLGETVAYVHPKLVGDVFNFSGSIVNGNAADGELLITAWLYRWGKSTDYQDLVNLTLQRRYT